MTRSEGGLVRRRGLISVDVGDNVDILAFREDNPSRTGEFAHPGYRGASLSCDKYKGICTSPTFTILLLLLALFLPRVDFFVLLPLLGGDKSYLQIGFEEGNQQSQVQLSNPITGRAPMYPNQWLVSGPSAWALLPFLANFTQCIV